jgi:hypothetical protein
LFPAALATLLGLGPVAWAQSGAPAATPVSGGVLKVAVSPEPTC